MITNKRTLTEKINKLKPLTDKSSIANLQCILFKDNALTAYNMEVGATCKLDTNTDESFLIPPNAMDLITKLPDGDIELTSNDKNVITIKSGDLKSKCNSYPPKEFPQPPTLEEGETNTIKAETLHEAINQVIYAASDNASISLALTGIYFECNGLGTLNLVGCDGSRLAWKRIPFNQKISLIIPKIALMKLARFGLQGDVKLLHKENIAVFKTEEYSFTTLLYSGDYLRYQSLIPKHEKRLTVDKKFLLDALERGVAATKGFKTIIYLAKEYAAISYRSQDGEYKENIPINNYSDDLKIAFNTKYLIDALKAMKNQEIIIKHGNEVEGLLIEDGDTTALVLPVRIEDK